MAYSMMQPWVHENLIIEDYSKALAFYSVKPEPPDPEWTLINKSDWKCLSFSYRWDVEELSRALNATKNLVKQRELFEEFSQKYTMHIDMLRKWKKSEILHINKFDFFKLEERETLINVKASQHFYDETFLNFSFSDEYSFPVLHKVITAYKFDHKFHSDVTKFLLEYRKAKTALTFPNPNLQECWDFCEENSLSPTTPIMEDRHKKLIKLWDKIYANKDNPVQWIRCLQETNDHEFIVQNIEVALAKMPFTKLAWKEYIEYLKKVDVMEMLNVYSRYCHFFINDWKMRESYRLEIVKLCKQEINVQHWIDDYHFLNKELPIHVDFEKLLQYLVKTFFTQKIQSIINGIKLCKFGFRQTPWKTKAEHKNDEIDENYTRGFKLHFIEYMVENANAKMLAKFYSISKWFYQKRKVPLCHRLGIVDNQKSISAYQSFFITPRDLQHDNLKNIYVTYSIVVTSKDPAALSKVIPRIFKFDAKIIKIENQNILFHEFCFLVSEGNVESIHFENVLVTWKSGERVPVEFLIERLPMAKCMRFERNAEIDPETSEKLGEIKLLNKIEIFSLGEIDETFDVGGFSKFVRINGCGTSRFCLFFKPVVSATFKSNFRRNFKNTIDSWFPRYNNIQPQDKPQIIIY